MKPPSRDPSHYHLSTHGLQRQKNRGIEKSDVANTIKHGIYQEAKGGYPVVKFVHIPMGVDEAIAVVANVEDGTIKTVYWDYECTHPAIVDLRAERGLEVQG